MNEPGVCVGETDVASSTAGDPIEVVIDGFQSNKRYTYRMRYRALGTTAWGAREEYSLHTQRSPGSTFTFTV